MSFCYYSQNLRSNQSWIEFRNDLAEDLKHKVQLSNPELGIGFTDAVYNVALIEIEDQSI